ncbi:SusC/RagA family TonB-linked outer membrane protein [Sinomicrobium soli]|uniref:SusC/RagA family TonB-linked outer membrane protein n=1 Tax=Sinomicrobium sp. N-1-3-6 TaxID=2219864 RepID=UPI000DCF1555|nr:SusC/RagA family TonB-linked outer membrane protein [Sinomicrobium sp. N-1-3-6]RAV28584.1 SusC/RagA family TonB-linked outer membrane protein [Sinomicrobium sp. N-1-3-6]
MRSKFTQILTLLLAFVVQLSFAQEKTITGNVTDETGMPLPGVNIVVKGTTNGTQTDFDGNYSISTSTGQVLQFTYVGMSAVEMTVGTSSVIDVQMQEDAQALEEVVVTALGLVRKPKELSYSVAKVDNEALTETRAVNAATAMVGKVSGLQINTISNGVNPNTRVVLRGNRSLLGENQALIVIDGYPSSRGALDRINPSDIENVSILKGSNASALYGSEASNGVVVITTKSGKGKSSITITSSIQQEKVSFMPKLQNKFGVGGFPDGTLWPLENVNWGPRYDGSMVAASEQVEDGSVWMVPFSPIKNNHKKFFNTGNTLRNSIEFSGGSDNGHYLFSLDQTNTEGVVPNDTYNRTNVRLKAGYDFGRLKTEGNLSFFRSHSNVVGEGGRQARPLYWYVLNTPLHIPLAEMKNWRTGKYTRNEVSYYRFYENPYFIIDSQRDYNDTFEINFISNTSYEFTDWLSANLRLGYTSYSWEEKEKHDGYTSNFTPVNAYSEIANFGATTRDEMFRSSRFNSDFIISIDKDLSESFNVNANFGQNIRITESKNVELTGENLIIPYFYNVSTRTGPLGGGEETKRYRKIGVYGDVTLGYNDYLFLNVTARNDWSSALSKENRSYFYPGVGVSFVPTDAFEGMKGNFLRYIKANFNVTKSGNDPSEYENQSVFSAPDGFPYGSTVGLGLDSRDADPDLQPEFTVSYEAGLEFAFFQGDRLSGNISLYQTNTTDQIVPINTSVASGANSYLTNIGEIKNQGIEIDLNGAIVKNEDFSWDLGINYALNKSEVLSLTDGVDELEVGSYYLDGPGYGAYVVAKVGEPYPLLKTTDYLRDDQGRVIVGDNGDPIQDTNLQIQGKTTPDYIVGVNTTFKYKGFSLYAVADYRTGHYFYNNVVDALEFTGLTQHSVTSNRQPFVFPNSVYSDGNGGYVENTDRLTTGGGNAFWDNYNLVKSNYVTDASVLKLREVSLAYSFGEEITGKLGLQDLRVSLYGRNLYMWRPKDNVYSDPEFNYNNGNAVGFGTQSQTPPTRQFGMALTVKF